MSNVLLLRDPSPISGDRYETAFNSAGFHAISVPVLETVFVNLSSLESLINDGPTAEGLDGVIITSGRACEAWKIVVCGLVESPREAGEQSEGQCLQHEFASPCYLTHVT